jgi:hypothetical protein
MKAADTKAVVLLDTNAYRRLGRSRTDAEATRKGAGLAARDAARAVQAVMHPLVVLELAAHLANLEDPEWADCRAALIVAWEHCATEPPEGGRVLAMMNDSETALCRLTYQRDPDGHAAVSERLATLCRRIATSDPEIARTNGHDELLWWAKHCKDIEDEFVADVMGIVRGHVPTAATFDALKRDSAARADALAIVDSPDFVSEMAAANVRKARRLLGMDPNSEPSPESVALVASAFRAPLELYRAVLRRVVLDGVDVSRTKYRNWIWDLHIAFSIGDFTVFGGRSIRFVSNDKMILEAAASVALGDVVCSFEDYSASLRDLKS